MPPILLAVSVLGLLACQPKSQFTMVAPPPSPTPGLGESLKGEEALGKLNKSYEIVERGWITPSIYNSELVEEKSDLCQESQKLNVENQKGSLITRLCAKTYQVCAEQGTCFVKQNDKVYRLNVVGRVKGRLVFQELSDSDCKFGLGVKDLCLDPYFTIAADLRIYQPGEVIFIPQVQGTKLPTDEIHSGLFIVRDQGQGIRGPGRFDIYSGFYSWSDSRNPFAQLNLADNQTHLLYFKIKGELADQFRKERQFPASGN